MDSNPSVFRALAEWRNQPCGIVSTADRIMCGQNRPSWVYAIAARRAAGDVFETELWVIMSHFGQQFAKGKMETPFVDFEIVGDAK